MFSIVIRLTNVCAYYLIINAIVELYGPNAGLMCCSCRCSVTRAAGGHILHVPTTTRRPPPHICAINATCETNSALMCLNVEVICKHCDSQEEVFVFLSLLIVKCTQVILFTWDKTISPTLSQYTQG